MMLKSKPLQSVLEDIRERQKAKLEDIKKTYGEAIKDLEPMKVVFLVELNFFMSFLKKINGLIESRANF